MAITPIINVRVDSAGTTFGRPSLFDLKILASSDPVSYALGRVDGWCADLSTDIGVPKSYNGVKIYSSYEYNILASNPHFVTLGENSGNAIIPSVPFDASAHPFLANLDIINWLINNVQVDSSSTYTDTIRLSTSGNAFTTVSLHHYTLTNHPGELFTYGDIQQAIYELLGDGWNNSPDYLGQTDLTRVTSMVNEAVSHDGFVPTAGQKLVVVLDTGANTQPLLMTTQAAALGDYVWHDLNANGIQDANETGIDGATVLLGRDLNNDGDISDANELLATTTTGDNPTLVGTQHGYYEFDGLTPGLDYQVQFVMPAGYAAASPRQAGGNTAADSDGALSNVVVLTPGQFNSTIDSGFYNKAALGDFVWQDKNANGIQDAGENGISGVTVNLLDATGTTVLGTTTTDASGLYHFTNLNPGSYAVQFVAPSGYTISAQDQGANDAVDSDANAATGKSQVVTLVSGQTDNTIDAGMYQRAALGDFVWEDKNANGIQDGGEAGIAGVTVNLLDSTGSNVLGTTTTDASGLYHFTGLVPGSYAVQFVAPSGYTISSQDQGANDAVDSDANAATGKSQVVTLVSGQTDNTIDAGMYQKAALGDFVWQDKNANGIQDAGENGISGVTVNLLDATGTTVLGTTTTDASGLYHFTNLNPGSYAVQFVAPSGYTISAQDQGANDAVDSDANAATGKSQVVTLASGQTDNTIDAGMYQKAAIGDRVWIDIDKDGVQDAGEPNVSGVKVNLLNSSGTTIGTQTTDGSGNYLFTNLTPGTYSIQFDLSTLPAGYTPTIQNAAIATTQTDSDANPLTGATVQTVLDSGETDLSWDMGIKANVAIDIEKLVHGEFVIQGGGGGEGLTPGFWKNHSSYGPAPLSGWPETGYSPDASYESIFGVDIVGSAPSLLDALGANGGGVNALMRHSAAALLNASDAYIDYAYTKAQIIAMTQAAINSGDANLIQATKDLFETQNQLGADLTTLAGGSTTVITPDVDADVGPGPTIPVGGTAVFTYVVTNPGTVALGNVVVTDDRLPAGSIHFVGGDTNHDNLLDTNETWTYTASEVVSSSGDHVNVGTVVGVSALTGESATDNDAAHYTTDAIHQTLGDRVWLDANANGIQDNGEAGVAGVTVQLKDSTGTSILQTTTTDANGNYLFDVNAGNYVVSFVTPAGYVVSPQDKGGNDNVDSDISPATKTTGVVSVAAGQQNLTVDAGLYQTASLGDRLWVDTNHDGQQNDGATGISGATVTLIGGGADGLINGVGDTTATTTTGVDGFYQFTGLTPGVQYQVQFSAPAGYGFTTQDTGNDASDSDANVATGKTQIVTLTSGEYNATLDAGVYQNAPGSIGDKVFCDANSNGIQDAGEGVVAGVTVKLLNTGGTVLATTTTAADGTYSFGGLSAGQYQVQFLAPSGHSLSPQDAGGNDNLDSDANVATGKTGVINLSAGQNITNIDAGVTPTNATFNFNGSSATSGSAGNIRSFTANGINVHVSAFSENQNSGAFSAAYLGSYGGGLGVTDPSEGTGSNNSHTVDNVGGQNNYVVFEFDQTVVLDDAFLGYVVGDSDLQLWIGNFANAYNNHLTLSDPVLSGMGFSEINTTTLTGARTANLNAGNYAGNVIVIAADPTDTTPDDYFKIQTMDVTSYACSLQLMAQLGDRVWLDKNANGQQDAGENGIGGVTVKLIGAGGDGTFGTSDDTVLGTTTTDAAGGYAFTNLSPGSYQVQFSAPSGYAFTGRDIGNDVSDSDANAATGRSQTVTLAAGQNNPTIDAGLYQTASVGSTVWCDHDADGIQDAGEDGVAGVTVKLIGAGADKNFGTADDTVLATTLTDANGDYAFSNLTPGSYQLQFVGPAGFAFTTANVGSNDNVDSDVNPATGKTGIVTLNSGDNNMSVDAGIAPLHAIFDFSGNSGTSGGAGNIRSYTQNGISVHASAFSEDKATGAWSSAFLGSYGGGLGVTDKTEGTGSGNTHTIDNAGSQNNYVLFEFDRQIVLDRAYLGYVVGDSDMQLWIGNFNDAYNSHIALSATALADMGFTEVNTTTLSSTRWANLNAGGFVGNVVVIAANTADSNDYFKIENLDVDSMPCDVPSAHIGNKVWLDANRNGIQDAGENGVAGVTVKLKDSNGVIVGVATTDASGNYMFDVTPGGYTVSVVAPTNYAFTGKDVGVNDALDSDVDAAGSSAMVTVAAGNTDNTVDAGLYLSTYTTSNANCILAANCDNLTYTGAGAFNGAGNNGNNVVTGGSGNDTLDGMAGADTLIGGAGNDTYIVDNAGDNVIEKSGQGTDTVKTALTSYTLDPNVENLIYTGSNAFAGTGNSGNNSITGGIGNDTLDGGTGNDSMAGGLGNDTYVVDSASDSITENPGAGTDTVLTTLSSYTLGSNVENLVYTGATKISATGNTLANALTGGGGGDTLTGGAGADLLTGGAGADKFVFSSADFGTVDEITDFSHAAGDKIDLSAIDANTTLANDQAFSFIGTGAFTGVKGQLHYTVSAGAMFVQGDANGDSIADFTIKVDGTGGLVSSDFVL